MRGKIASQGSKSTVPRLKNKKSLGQHWLKDREILEEIAALAAGYNLDTLEQETPVPRVCLEIGPGLGTLTSKLLKQFPKVVAVELDENLARNLPKSFPGKNLEVIQGDFLALDVARLSGANRGEDLVIAGNIPYYITGPILEKVLNLPILPRRIVLLVQKEMAQKLTDKRESLLSLRVKNRAEVVAGPEVPREKFTPPPKVDSQVIILRPHAPVVEDKVMRLIQQGFAAPRKKLAHNLTGRKSAEEIKGILRQIGVDENVRPGDLSLLDWQNLAKNC